MFFEKTDLQNQQNCKTYFYANLTIMQKPFLNANKARILLVNSNANLSTEADPCVFSSIIDFDLELFISSWV